MAFVAVVPAVGSAVLPAIGAIGSGLGGALATGAGALGSGIAGLGSALGSVPLIGGIASPALTGLGGAIGGLGGGLGGAMGLLGAGNLGGALGSAMGGLGAAGSNLLGGLGGMYGGADKLLGGFLPNLGIAGTITPAQGALGSIPMIGQNPVFGGTPNPFATHGVMNFNPNDPFHVAQAQGLTAPTSGAGGLMGVLKTLGEKAGKANAIMGAIDSTRTPAPSPASVHFHQNQQPVQPVVPNSASAPSRRTGIFDSSANQSPGSMFRTGGVRGGIASPYYANRGAQESLGRAFG